MLRSAVGVTLLLGMVSLSAREKSSEPLTVPQEVASPVATPSGVASETPVIPTPTLNSKQLFTLHVEQTHAAERTAFALSGIPTRTPGAPPPYTGPTVTPVLGLLRGCAGTNTLEPIMVSCWRGVYNGHIVNVSSGSEGLAGDITQGLVWVYSGDPIESQYIPDTGQSGSDKASFLWMARSSPSSQESTIQ